MIVNSLAGLPAFAAYFLAAILASVAFVFIYTKITPNRELELIATGNPAAALSVGMSLIGFSLPLASAIFHTEDMIDCLIWAVIALVAQLLAWWLAHLVMPKLADGIAKGEIAAGIWVGCVSIAAGVLNAACMTY
jgi:putative membrane protein